VNAKVDQYRASLICLYFSQGVNDVCRKRAESRNQGRLGVARLIPNLHVAAKRYSLVA